MSYSEKDAITMRIDELKRIVQNVNVHDDNRILLMLMVEELSYLHDEVESWRRFRDYKRKDF